MLAMTLVTLVQQVIASPIAMAAQRFYATAAQEQTLAFYERALIRLVYKSTLLIGIFAVLSVILCASINQLSVAATVGSSSLLAVFLGAGAVMDGILNAARRRIVVAWHQAATQWFRWLFAMFAVLLFGVSATSALIGCCVAMLALCITRAMALFYCRSTHQGVAGGTTESQWHLRLQQFVWPFALWGIFTWAVTVSDRWSLQLFAATSDVGQYTVLYQLGFFPCVLLADSLQQLVGPILFQRAGLGSDASRQHSVRVATRCLLAVFAFMLSIGLVALWLLHRPILDFFVGAQFRHHSELLPWVAMSGGLFALGQLAALSIVSGPSVRALVPVKIGSALLGIVANAVGARVWGLPGVVFATCITSAIYFCWTLLVSQWNANRRVRTATSIP
jgi:O-antigen/teichoic acid export membrane protein